MPTRKVEIRLFLEPPLVRRIDRLVREGWASSRSEAIRKLLAERELLEGRLREHEERIRALERKLGEGR